MNLQDGVIRDGKLYKDGNLAVLINTETTDSWTEGYKNLRTFPPLVLAVLDGRSAEERFKIAQEVRDANDEPFYSDDTLTDYLNTLDVTWIPQGSTFQVRSDFDKMYEYINIFKPENWEIA